ncbi:protein MAIN-LIKE 2-like isoform X2 [Aristolochia californica]|uniref:protein MAIN-LIKE 2-like isoform X2 n=1 Tax=Aristolochia californica TaxID=171875 RepID=UPI0035D62F30
MALAPKTHSKEGGASRDNKIQCRCCPSRFVDKVNELALTDRHKEILNQTPFGHLISLPKVVVQRTLIDDLLGRWKFVERAFQLGSKLVAFLPSDVALIMGLSMRGGNIDHHMNVGISDIHTRLFTTKIVKRDMIEARLIEVSKGECQESIHDTVKLLVLYLFCVFLFPYSNVSLPYKYFRLVDNLEGLCDYAWANAVHEFLVDSISVASKKVQERNSGAPARPVGYLNGCAIVLESWLFEHTTKWLPISKNLFPRIKRWYGGQKQNKYRRKGFYSHHLQELNDRQVIEVLEPGDGEESMLLPLSLVLVSSRPNKRLPNVDLNKRVRTLKRQLEACRKGIQKVERQYKRKITTLEEEISILKAKVAMVSPVAADNGHCPDSLMAEEIPQVLEDELALTLPVAHITTTREPS